LLDTLTVTTRQTNTPTRAPAADRNLNDVQQPRRRYPERRSTGKRQRRLSGIDDLVISLSAKGLTHGEISAHLAEIYGAEVSKQTISTDYRSGDGGYDGVTEPATRRGLSGDLHRLREREDPRRQRGEPADLRRAGRDVVVV
jgi:hypothetical protein